MPSIELEGDVAVNHKAKHHDDSVCVNEVVGELRDKVSEQNEEVYPENIHVFVKHTLKRSFSHLFLNTVLFIFEARHDLIKMFIILDSVDKAFSSITHLDYPRLYTLNKSIIRDIKDLPNVRVLHVKLIDVVSEPIIRWYRVGPALPTATILLIRGQLSS